MLLLKNISLNKILCDASAKMTELRLMWILTSCLIGVSLQQCTLDMFRRNASHILNSFETTWHDPSINITSTYYNCLSRSDTSDHYSSMSVSILYIRSDDPNNTHEVHYNLQCNNSVWEIVGNQSTALRSNNTRYCDDCTDQTVNEYHCTLGELFFQPGMHTYLANCGCNHGCLNLKTIFCVSVYRHEQANC